MKITPKLITQLMLIIIIMTSCAIKKYTISSDFYSSGSELGLLQITNDIGTRRSGQSAVVLATTNKNKYDEPLMAVDPRLDPEKKFMRMYLDIFKSKGKKIVVIEDSFTERQYPEFEKPDRDKDYYKYDLRSLKEKYKVDELMIVIIDYGLFQNYSGMIEMGKGGYSHVVSNIINLNDNSLIYKGETWGNGKLKSKWDNPPDYEFLREAVDAAINQSVELERTKYL